MKSINWIPFFLVPGSSGIASLTPSGTPNLPPTVAQLRAAQAAMAKSSSTVSKLPTVKQLTSNQQSIIAPPITTSSVLTVTSVGLSVTSSLAAQLLYSSGLTMQGTGVAGVSRLAKPSSAPVTTATTYSLVTTMNVGQSQSATPTPRSVSGHQVPTISMLQGQHLLKQQVVGAQSVLKQNAAVVAAVGQSVGNPSTTSVHGLSKNSGLSSKHTFSMTSRQAPPPNVTVSKNLTPVVSSKAAISGLKQASLILSQDGMASLTPMTSASTPPPSSKLVALTSVPVSSDGTVMAQLVQPNAGQMVGARGAIPQTIKLQGKLSC